MEPFFGACKKILSVVIRKPRGVKKSDLAPVCAQGLAVCLGAKGSPGAICKVSSWPLPLGPAPDLRAASLSSALLFFAVFGKASPLPWADRMVAAYRV